MRHDHDDLHRGRAFDLSTLLERRRMLKLLVGASPATRWRPVAAKKALAPHGT